MIPKEAKNLNNFIRDARFFDSARSAWKACLMGLQPKRVLLPAYIGFTDREGSGVIDPLIELNIPISFYSLDINLLFHPSVIHKSLVEYPEIDVIVVIHYFGWPGANMEIIRSICNTANITLIEDCAHAFHWGHPKQNLGIKGDYAFYSIHKYLPVKSGGILHAINKPIRIEMEPVDNNINFEIIEVLSKAQLDKIALRRRLNFKRAVNGISKFKGITILRSNIPLTPQSLPVLIHGEGIREKVYFSLLKKGIATTALYYRLHEYIDKINFESSFQISDQILNIPIHQDLTNNMIDEMINEFKISLVEATK